MFQNIEMFNSVKLCSVRVELVHVAPEELQLHPYHQFPPVRLFAREMLTGTTTKLPGAVPPQSIVTENRRHPVV